MRTMSLGCPSRSRSRLLSRRLTRRPVLLILSGRRRMKIRAGYEIAYDCAQATPMLLMLRVHPSRQSDLENPERIALDPPVRATEYRDGFGNLCTRLTAPPGRITISNDFIVRDGGEPNLVVPEAEQHALEDLPDHVLVFL